MIEGLVRGFDGSLLPDAFLSLLLPPPAELSPLPLPS